MKKERRALFGKNIKYYRKKKGWTQFRLGMELGLTHSVIEKYENATYGKMTSKRIYMFAQALDVSIEQLFDETINYQNKKDLGLIDYSRNIRKKRLQKDGCKKRLGRFI